MLTLAEAAKEIGLTKPGLFKAIKNGRISATKDDKGEWLIDPAELFRVYPPATKKETVETQTGNFELMLKLKEVEAKLEVNQQRLLDREREVDDLRVQRDHWRTQAEVVTHLLADQREKEQAKKPGFWEWFIGKKNST